MHKNATSAMVEGPVLLSAQISLCTLHSYTSMRMLWELSGLVSCQASKMKAVKYSTRRENFFLVQGHKYKMTSFCSHGCESGQLAACSTHQPSRTFFSWGFVMPCLIGQTLAHKRINRKVVASAFHQIQG